MATFKQHQTKRAVPSYGHSNFHMLNDKEMLLVPENYAENAALWKFDINDKDWMKWYDFAEMGPFEYHTSALNNDKTKLYIFGDPGYIIIIDLKTGQSTMTKRKFHDGAHSKSLFIDNQFHIFGGWNVDDNAHFIYNEANQQLIKVHHFNEITGIRLTDHRLCYSKMHNSVIIMTRQSQTTIIYSYSLDTNKCEQIAADILKNEMGIRLLCVQNGAKVLLFGPDQFFMLDLDDKLVKECMLQIPDDPIYFTMISENNYEQELVTFGYIHQQIESESVDIPLDVIKMIESFVSFEVLYLLSEDTYYTVNVDNIINTCQ